MFNLPKSNISGFGQALSEIRRIYEDNSNAEPTLIFS